MPRTNHRSRGPEADVAARIALEREQRRMSAAALARRMTELGCRLNASAINKIEQGRPPRRITVDELDAFAKVFDLDIADLLVPAHAARDIEVERAYRGLREAADHMQTTAEVCRRHIARLDELTSLGTPLNLAGPLRAFSGAVEGLATAVADVSDDVRDRLRRDPPGLAHTSNRAVGREALPPATRSELRAARAAAPPKRSRGVNQDQPTGK